MRDWQGGSLLSVLLKGCRDPGVGRPGEAPREQDVWDGIRQPAVGECEQGVSFIRPDCSSGLASRNSCGEIYIFKVGLNVFHCWKICHYGHFSPPNSWTAMPPKLPSHCSLSFLSD